VHDDKLFHSGVLLYDFARNLSKEILDEIYNIYKKYIIVGETLKCNF
jgi:hypothetical protein